MIRRGTFAVVSLPAYLSRPLWVFVLLSLTLLVDRNESLAQSLSLFTDAAPVDAAVSSTSASTLGVKFWSSQSGTISAIKFYRGAKSPNGYVARLYSATGTLLGSVTMAQESGPVPGWQQAVFASPIAIAANTGYVAAYYAPTGQYADTPQGLQQSVSNGPLIAPAASLVGGNGVYGRNRQFPIQDYQNTNYFVDVAFVPAGSPYLNITVSPSNSTISSTTPLGATVAQVTAAWSDGSPFTGTLSFGPPNFNAGGVYALDGNNLIISPNGPGVGATGGTTAYVTIVATQ
jgi:hypothetical protein